MMANVVLLILAAGVPYYVFLEKSGKFSSKQIFLISAFLLLCAVAFSYGVPGDRTPALILIALASALFSIYKATRTTNFYKLGYYLIFVNAPFFILFENHGVVYSLSLLVSLLGIYLVANYYQKNYGSANYHHISGITLATPCIGTYLLLYLIALALYPPFPNAIFFLSYMFKSDPNPLWFIVIAILFFGNFFLAMRVMKTTLFGRPNTNIHYVHMTLKEKITHSSVVALLLLLSIFGLKETLL